MLPLVTYFLELRLVCITFTHVASFPYEVSNLFLIKLKKVMKILPESTFIPSVTDDGKVKFFFTSLERN